MSLNRIKYDETGCDEESINKFNADSRSRYYNNSIIPTLTNISTRLFDSVIVLQNDEVGNGD